MPSHCWSTCVMIYSIQIFFRFLCGHKCFPSRVRYTRGWVHWLLKIGRHRDSRLVRPSREEARACCSLPGNVCSFPEILPSSAGRKLVEGDRAEEYVPQGLACHRGTRLIRISVSQGYPSDGMSMLHQDASDRGEFVSDMLLTQKVEHVRAK